MNQAHQTYTKKLYIGQYVNAPSIGLGRIKELGDGQAIIQSIITEQQVILTLEQVELLRQTS